MSDPAGTIERPIFIVGCGRSGTTILYELLCAHPELAWFSNFTERLPRLPQAAALSRVYTSEGLRRWWRGPKPKPVEGYPLWDRCRPVADSPCDPMLTARDLRPADLARARRLILDHMKYQRARRFINKNTRNTRRVGYLNAMFPDALFIHIVRDPRATVHSLLNVRFWPQLRIWCERNVTPGEWEAAGHAPAALAARLWRAEVECGLAARDEVGAGRYFEVRYEELTARPAELLTDILAFCGLPPSDRFARFVDRIRLRNMNAGYRENLAGSDIRTIEQEVAPLARRLGYLPGAPCNSGPRALAERQRGGTAAEAAPRHRRPAPARIGHNVRRG